MYASVPVTFTEERTYKITKWIMTKFGFELFYINLSKEKKRPQNYRFSI